jgi:hypothetical protein
MVYSLLRVLLVYLVDNCKDVGFPQVLTIFTVDLNFSSRIFSKQNGIPALIHLNTITLFIAVAWTQK